MENKKNTICRLREVHRAISGLDAEFQRKFGLNLNEAMLLCFLAGQGSASASELSDELGLTHSNMSKVLASAEKTSLISRKLNPADKRGMIFSLTDEGHIRLASIRCEELVIPDLLKEILD